jgi:hypothetical protein
MIEQDFQIAIDSVGHPYLDAERRLIEQGETSVTFLQQKLDEASPQSRRVIQVILEWLAGNETYTAVIDYFEQVAQRAAETAMLVPHAEGVSNYLLQNFGDSVAELLGVYLLKLAPIWPNWQTSGVLLYFGKLNGSTAAEPLIQFIVTTSNDTYRELAVSSLIAVGNENVLDTVEKQINALVVPQQALQQAADRIRDALQS